MMMLDSLCLCWHAQQTALTPRRWLVFNFQWAVMRKESSPIMRHMVFSCVCVCGLLFLSLGSAPLTRLLVCVCVCVTLCLHACGNSRPPVFLWLSLTCWVNPGHPGMGGGGQRGQDVRVETVLHGRLLSRPIISPLLTSDLFLHTQQQTRICGWCAGNIQSYWNRAPVFRSNRRSHRDLSLDRESEEI